MGNPWPRLAPLKVMKRGMVELRGVGGGWNDWDGCVRVGVYFYVVSVFMS